MRVGDAILQVDGTTVSPTVDVRALLMNQNAEVRLVVQSGDHLFGGPSNVWRSLEILGGRHAGHSRNVVIKRRPANSTGGRGRGAEGGPAAATRSPNVDDTMLPPAAQAMGPLLLSCRRCAR